MLLNNLKLAIRNFFRRPTYTLINVLGLTLGITTTLFILMYITMESSFDQHHQKADRIFRISSDITEPDAKLRWVDTQPALGPHLKTNYPEVEEFVRVINNGETRFEFKGNTYLEDKVFIVDSTVFNVFTFDFIYGNPKTALQEPNSLVINQSIAQEIFGNIDPVGKELDFEENHFRITGVYKDMPANSHLIARAMASLNSFENYRNATSWGGFFLATYVLLKENISANSFASKLPEVIEKNVAGIFAPMGIKIKYELLPLKDIHLKSTFEGEPEPRGEISFLYIFGLIGLFLLLLAAINYMNLSTARATKRATEVGVRKVLGSQRKQLIVQFLSESILFTLIALAISIFLVFAFLPIFNGTFDLQLSYKLLFQPKVILGVLGVILFLGIIGGSYPAFFLSSFQPIGILKGSLAKGSGNPTLRKALVGVQFAVTLFMLIGTGVIYDQMNYLRNKDLGFDKEQVFTTYADGDKYELLREKLIQHPKIAAVGASNYLLGEGVGRSIANVETATGDMREIGINSYGVDYDFFPTLGIEIINGRNFNRGLGTDTSRAIIVNEAMVKRMNWENPIGRKINIETESENGYRGEVVGVIKDFHQESLYTPITALAFTLSTNNGATHIRFNAQKPDDISEVLAYTEEQFQSIFPEGSFQYEFLNMTYGNLYQSDQKRAKIFSLFSVIMIFIACLGLLGLASFSSEQRTKEIGVRKVLGAQTYDIVYLLTRNYLVLIGLAAVPAFLASWVFMKNWLSTFAYHTNMNFWVYGLAVIIVMILTFLTTGYFALKAARNNPVSALRQE